MVDARFFRNSGPFSIGQLADHVGGVLAKDAPRDMPITDIATLDEAGPTELSMFADARYRDDFNRTRAGAVLTSKEFGVTPPARDVHLIFVPTPRLAYAEAAWMLYPEGGNELTSEPTQSSNFTLGDGCYLSPSANVGANAIIGARARIGHNAVIGRGVVIGDDCIIGANATISHAIIGNRVQVYPGACIGIQGFGFVPGPQGLRRVPQLGRVIIEDGVEIGSNSTIDRGAIGDTCIGAGSVIDNLVHIAHNVRIGRFCVIAAQAGVAGSTQIGDGVMIGGHAGIKDHLTIGSGAQIAGASGVIRDVGKGERVAGYPAIPVREWHRQTLGLRRMFARSN